MQDNGGQQLLTKKNYQQKNNTIGMGRKMRPYTFDFILSVGHQLLPLYFDESAVLNRPDLKIERYYTSVCLHLSLSQEGKPAPVHNEMRLNQDSRVQLPGGAAACFCHL